ncbi:MAG: citrate/2-methylcitrate synthase [Planctomycetota bacterium]|jgi:citrate synthase
MSPTETYSPGLEGVVAGETAVSTLTGGLSYRGYPVVELVKKCDFLEVAYLLLYGDLPDPAADEAFRDRLASTTLPAAMSNWLEQIPRDAVPMDVVRLGIDRLALHDPETQETGREATLRKSERLLAQVPLLIGALAAHRHNRAVFARPALGLTGNLLAMSLGREPTAEEQKAFDLSLILYAEHEFNASTFTARVVTSTEADLHSAVSAAIGALKGPLHGGANERAMDVIRAAGPPAGADAWLKGALARKDKIMGFGHRVYKAGDVRAGILKPYSHEAMIRAGHQDLEATSEIIEKGMEREKNLFANVDWPAGRLYFAIGLDVPLYTPFFVAARVTGWCAHVLEQQAKNRIIRPKSLYIGHAPRPVK